MADPVRGDVSEVADGPEYDLDFREHPERYRRTNDERGAFKIEPYKSELLPLWGVATLDEAEDGAAAIHDRFREYRDAGDFVGMDMYSNTDRNLSALQTEHAKQAKLV